MGASQGCSSTERVQPCGIIQPIRPVRTIASEISSAPSKRSTLDLKSDTAARRPISLWAKCKDAVHEFRRFQRFLMRYYSGPNQAFDLLFQACKNKGSARDRVEIEDFICLVDKAGFKGDTRVVFAMLKDGADDFITRDSFRRRLKGRRSTDGDKFLAVVGHAVATAALVDNGVGAVLEGFEQGRSRWGRCEEGMQKPRGRSNDTESTEASSNASRSTSKDDSTSPRRRTGGHNVGRRSSKEPKRRRSSSKTRSTSPKPPGRCSNGQSRSPESPKRNKSIRRQKSR